MGFFDGSSSDDSQWVALSINIFTCFLYGFLIRREVKNKEEQHTRINKKKETFIYIGLIILAILATALYYIIREKVFLKDDKEANIIGWNILYFAISIVILISPILLP
jgi:hypothetical protein